MLLSEPNSIFSAMLQGEWAHVRRDGQEGGLIFDRDPKRFRVVLNWLRTREIVLEGGVTAEGVQSEAEFFQLSDLADEAAQIIEEREGLRLLQAAFDSRRGKLVALGPGEAASLPTGEPVLVRGPCVFAMQASFEAVGAGIIAEIVVDGSDKGAPEYMVHSFDGGRLLRAVGRVGAGRHRLQLLFRHVGMDARQPRAHVFGPARVEFWRYPCAAVVWMDEAAALSNTAAWYAHMHGPPSSPFTVAGCAGGGASGTNAQGVERGETGIAGGWKAPNSNELEMTDARQDLATMVGAMSSCVYR